MEVVAVYTGERQGGTSFRLPESQHEDFVSAFQDYRQLQAHILPPKGPERKAVISLSA